MFEVRHFTNTEMFIRMADWSWKNKMNRSLKPESLDFIDPEGLHLCVLLMTHNHRDGELFEEHFRTAWLVKAMNEELPIQMFLDIDKKTYIENVMCLDSLNRIQSLKGEKEDAEV